MVFSILTTLALITIGIVIGCYMIYKAYPTKYTIVGLIITLGLLAAINLVLGLVLMIHL